MGQGSKGEIALLAFEAARRLQSEALAGVERELLAELDSTRFLHLLVESASQLFESQASVWLITEGGDLAQRITSVPGALPVGRVTLGEGVTGRCAQERRGVLVSDYPRWPHAIARYAGLRHAMAHPLVMGDELLGVIAMSRSGAGVLPFTEGDFAGLEHLAGLAALALRNARLYEEANRRRREAEELAKVARTLTGTLDVGQVASLITESVLTLFPGCFGVGVIASRADGRAALIGVGGPLGSVFPLGHTVLPGTFLDRVGVQQRTLWIPDLLAAPEPDEPTVAARRREWIETGVRACLGMPLVVRGRTIGVLGIAFDRPRAFAEHEITLGEGFADQAALALENAHLYQEAERRRREAEVTGGRLQALSLRLLEVQEAERRHLARELHDEVGQALTAVKINLQMLRRLPQPEASQRRLDDSLGIVDQILHGVRQMSLDLRPSLLDDLGLAAALRWYVGAQARRAGLEAEIRAGALPDDLSAAAAITCYRVVQEAVTNVVRHAGATRLGVALACAEGGLEMSITDDGIGFDVGAVRREALQGQSMGLFGLAERVQLAGGRSYIESAPGRGTTVRAWLPLSGRAEPGAGAP